MTTITGDDFAQIPGADAEEIIISSASIKLIHEKSDPVASAIMYSIVENEDMSGSLLAAQMSGMDKKAKRMISYAERKKPDGTPEYPFELPEIQLGTHEDEYFEPKSVNPEGYRAYPIVVIRENQVMVGETPGIPDKPLKDDKFITTRRMIKKAGFNLKDLQEGLAGTEDEPNPDIDSLDDTFFAFATDIYSEIESTAQYQWNFFDWLLSTQTIGEPAPLPPGGGDPPPILINNYIAFNEYTDTENKFYCAILWDYIIKETIKGDLTISEEDDHELAYKKFMHPGEPGSVVIDKQLGPGKIERLTIYGIEHQIFIDAKGETKKVAKGIQEEFVGLDPDSEDEEEAQKAGTGAFMIPMIYEILELSTNKHEQIALYDGAMLYIFAADEIKLKWYQTKWFRLILIVIMLVITYVTAGSFAAFVQKVGILLLKALIVSFIFQLLISLVGAKYAAILMAAYIVYSATSGGGMGMASATELLHTAKVVLKTYAQYTNYQAALIEEDMEDLLKSEEDRKADKKEVMDLLGEDLGGGISLDWMTAPNTLMDPGIDIETMYYMAIHDGNPGVRVKDQISGWVAAMLTQEANNTFPLNEDTRGEPVTE